MSNRVASDASKSGAVRTGPVQFAGAAQGRRSRRKGAVAEREVAALLRSRGYPARRGQQRSGRDSADVVDGPVGWHLEVKRVENLSVWKAWAQAVRDARDARPAVVARRSGHEWLAVVRLADLLDLLDAVELQGLA